MKKFYALTLLLLCTFAVSAQNDVTKFLGIPVDGTKEEMIQKLKAKGFRSSTADREMLEGEFNGTNVYIGVYTNNNKVYRIAVLEATILDETEIRIRFNTLCRQFENNDKYVNARNQSQMIPENEKIGYEMRIHNKRYEADYFQKSTDNTRESLEKRLVWFTIQSFRYGEYSMVIFYDNEYNHANGEDL